MGCIVIEIVCRIAGVNAPIWYNATHYYANSSHNSLRLKNRRCELTIPPACRPYPAVFQVPPPGHIPLQRERGSRYPAPPPKEQGIRDAHTRGPGE